MHRPSRLFTVCFVLAAVAIAGCAKKGASTAGVTAAPSPATSGAPASPGVAPSGSPAAAISAPASPAATPTPEPNLLSWKNGTIVRSYPPDEGDPADSIEGYSPSDNANGPWVWVYELPGMAKLTAIAAEVPDKDEQGKGATVTFAVSTTGADTGFSDIGTISSRATPGPNGEGTQTVPVNASARWVRVTATRTATAQPITLLAVYGQIAPLPPGARLDGTYVQYDNPFSVKTGRFASAPDNNDPWYLQVVSSAPQSINGEQCFSQHLGDSYPGTLVGRAWNWQRGDEQGTFIANDDASMLVGVSDGNPSYWVRTNVQPAFCGPQTFGHGPENVLVLDSRDWHYLYPMSTADEAANAPHYRFTRIGASLVTQTLLSGASTLVMNGLCNADHLLTPVQGQMITQWVASGHKLMIYDSDMCSKPTTYSFLPYQFRSDNPGAQGAKGDRLILVEDNTLGTSDKRDKAHYFDPQPWVSGGNQLGDANTVTTQDSHWCGHLFGTNVNHVNGFMQMYTNYGKGVIIYDGFDHDDGDVPSYQRVRMLELDQPIPADLPCTQQVSLAFLIEPNHTGTFVPGKPRTMTFPMELLANQGWKGHVNVTTSGDFKASVTPNSFDVAGGTQPLKIAVSIPGNAKPGTYNVIVTGDGGNKQTAQASIQLTAAVPVVKLFQQKRIRLYGIHFDVDKWTIKPQSQKVIAEIAAVMKQNPSWRFRVEGHTDSDGGYQHNMVLSQHRAESVVNDLVNRYHIARSRLVPVGYGYSRPVAPNTTAAGKALNRRVELVRL